MAFLKYRPTNIQILRYLLILFCNFSFRSRETKEMQKFVGPDIEGLFSFLAGTQLLSDLNKNIFEQREINKADFLLYPTQDYKSL